MLDRFWKSAHARGVDDEDGRSLLETFTWFGSGYGSGDLLQWSPVRVELLLADWLPRKVVAPRDYLAKAPQLVKAFVRFCHAERGISDSLDESDHLFGLIQFKVGTGGQAAEYLGEWDFPLNKLLHKALDIYMSRR